jgi:hypothetical protein
MRERSIVQILTTVAFVLLFVPLSFAQTAITMGETAILNSGDNGKRNLLLAQQATLAQAATLQSFSFYVTRSAGQLRLGIYDASGPDGGPGIKKGETAAFNPVVGWNTRSVTTPVLLAAGTYWLAYLPSGNTLAFRKESTGSARYYSRTFGAMPTTFSTSPTAEEVHWSLYATLTQSEGQPAPTVSLVASTTRVAPGGSSTLTWSSTDATSCTASNVGAEGSRWSGPKPTSGSDVRGPLTATATYSLACTGPGGTASQAVTITVTSNPTPGPTLSLSANPTTVPSGGSSTLTWSSTNATSCTASNVGAEGGTWAGPKPTSGSDVRGPLTATATYSLACTGPGGTASRSVTITVTSAPVPTVSLTATPTTIAAGQSTTLAWSSTNAASCTATGGWSGAQPLSGELVVLTASTATYTLTCAGAGGSAAKSVTVTVIGGPARLTLTWVDNAAGTAIFKIERKTQAAGTYAQIATTGAGAVQYVDATPATGTTYCYRVRAANANGNSDYSNEACATP